MKLGIDASTYRDVLAHGARYFDGRQEMDPLAAFRANGVELMRIRVWNAPVSPDGAPYGGGDCDWDNYLKLGALAKSRGFALMMDLHYSDFWADPHKQVIPKAWQGLELAQLCRAVYAFTRDCLSRAKAAGLAPVIVQPGNEITNGLLWPMGQLREGPRGREGYDALGRLLSAACRACREVLPEAKIALHLERSNDCAVYQEFFGEMARAGVDYDIIGASYYPYWHGTPEELFANLDACLPFGKERMVLELGYGFTTRPYRLAGKEVRLLADTERAVSAGFAARYPMTPEGQAAFVRDFLAMAGERGIDGVFYWEPLWLPGEGITWATPAGQAYIREEGKSTANEWANQCLFDYEGQKLPAFEAFAAAAR